MSVAIQEDITKMGQKSKRKKEEVFNDELLGLEVLCYLESIGFSVKHPGTYLYNDLIKKIILIISDEEESMDEVVAHVQNPYSVIYEDIATYTYGIEILNMHSLIYQACPDDEFKRGYMNKALEIAQQIIYEKKEKFVLTRKKSEEI